MTYTHTPLRYGQDIKGTEPADTKKIDPMLIVDIYR
jgi:hypothetical protein